MKNDKLVQRTGDPASGQCTNDRSTRRTEITIETREIKTIRMRSLGGSTFCGECGEISPSYGPAYVAAFLQISLDDVLRSIASGQIHVIAGGSGLEDVCGNSLKYLTQSRTSGTGTTGWSNT